MKERDSLVLNIELTLISIIQGVALYFLVESSRVPIVERNYASWPYIANGLMIILIFWSRSILHGLTVIRWPLEFGHNFLYIASTLLECIAFTQVGNPQSWFLLNAVYGGMIWLLFLWDLRWIRRRIQENGSSVNVKLLLAVASDQRLNIFMIVPATIVFTLGSALAIRFFPELLLQRSGHIYLALAQLLAAFAYLGYGLRLYNRLNMLQDRSD